MIDPKAKLLIPMCEPLRTETCKKCRSVIAELKELIGIVSSEEEE